MKVEVPDSDSCELPMAEPEVHIGRVFTVPTEEVETMLAVTAPEEPLKVET